MVTAAHTVFYERTTAEFQKHEDRSWWHHRKTRLLWLLWPSTQWIGKDIRANPQLFTRRAANVISEACIASLQWPEIAMMHELAVIDLSMTTVALSPSWFVWILTVILVYFYFNHSCFVLFCFWTQNYIYFTSVSFVWFWFTIRKLIQSNWA